MTKEKKKRYNFYIQEKIYQDLTDFSEKSGIVRSQVITLALKELFERANLKDEGNSHNHE